MVNKQGRDIVYMAVTDDKYEVVCYMFETRKEMAEFFGITTNCLSSTITHAKNGELMHSKGKYKFIKVEIEDDDDNEEAI